MGRLQKISGDEVIVVWSLMAGLGQSGSDDFLAIAIGEQRGQKVESNNPMTCSATQLYHSIQVHSVV